MNQANRTTFSALALGIAGVLAMGQAGASGFQLKENSVKGMGAAFAGSGVNTGDSSVVVNNPATMTQFEGTTVQSDVTVIDLSYQFEGSGTDALGQPLTGSDGGNAGDVTPVPALSVIHKLDNGLALGAMVSAPFGLKTEYDDGWMGRYYAHTSDVKIVDLTLSAAVDIVPDVLSVGIGAIYSRADVTLSKSVDFGTLLFANPATNPLPFARPQAADGFAEVSGEDNGFGWLVGVNLRPSEKFSLGLSYRSEIDYDLEGSVDWTVPANVQAVLGASPTTSPLFRDGDVTAALTTPSVLSLAARYDITDRFAVMGSWSETGWSSLREVRINFVNPDPDSVEPFDWKDTEFVSLGAEYKLNDAWTLRGGAAFDETPTNIESRTPRLPDDDRTWYSIGATWQLSEAMEVSFAVTHIKPDDPRVDIADNQGHHLAGPFDGDANLYGISGQYRF
jgi:long-chain fatty acid transport protein